MSRYSASADRGAINAGELLSPDGGLVVLKNNSNSLFWIILALAAGSLFVAVKQSTRFGLDVQGGMRMVLRADITKKPKGVDWDAEKLNGVANIIRNRVDALGVAEPIVYPKPAEDRIVVELPGLTNRDQARQMIQSTAKLEFRSVPELDNGTWNITRGTTTKGGVDYEKLVNSSTGKEISPAELQDRVFSKDPLLSGDRLKSNSRAELPMGKAVIHFEFQDDAKGIFEEFTRGHVGKHLAIFLDGKLLSAPNINDVIPGTGIIEGNFTAESAKALADQLNAGALPVPLIEEETVNIEPTLGKQAVTQATTAGAIGLFLVLIIMLYWYKVPGLIADGALILYALFTFALFKLIPVTLTVPGIAGFILSIGMAVDANILIFERMKEERVSGKTIKSSVETGFKRAFTAILDSNICTLITCGILYQFGTGSVRGFALTLAVGVAVSMFTAITCTRTFLLMFAGTAAGQIDKNYALTGGAHPKLDVSKKMPLWFGISAIIILPGLLAWGAGGIHKNIEFTGGTEIQVRFTSTPTAAAIQSALGKAGINESNIVIAQDNRAFITTPRLDDAKRTTVLESLQSGVSPFAKGTTVKGSAESDVSYSNVSGTISAELTKNAILAVIYASVLIILYLALRFSIPNFIEGLKFGTCAVAALLHDVGVLWGSFAILGFLFHWQIDSLFVTAMLTVIGFSVHDTIIIFDRIRENLTNKTRFETFADVADRSIEQTFARSIRTSATVVITLTALLLAGGTVVRLFVAALLIGIVSGTYSSIFNATPLLIWWKRKSADAAAVAASVVTKPIPIKTTPKPVVSTGIGGETQTLEEAEEELARNKAIKRRRRRM